MGNLIYWLVAAACVGVLTQEAYTSQHTPSSQSKNYNLVLGESGGYARLMSPPPPLPSLTLSAWVNVTDFPNGVAPILTVVSPDARTQTAFFLRHDGLGVLWGGPTASAYLLDQVDRHPRTRWSPVEVRRKRDAKDYSGGLGDIVDILADTRRGRSYDTWTPFGFVDVDQMGVADLVAAPSSSADSLHILPTREGLSRSESYNDWTNVPYELTMLESDPYERHLADRQLSKPDALHEISPELRIITEPSGDDDFVFFNWNVPSAAQKQTIPQSPHQWSPMWHTKNAPVRGTAQSVSLPVKAQIRGTAQTVSIPVKATAPIRGTAETVSIPVKAKAPVVGTAHSISIPVKAKAPVVGTAHSISIPVSASTSNNRRVSDSSGSWSSQVTAVKLGENNWTPQHSRPVFKVVAPPRPQTRPQTKPQARPQTKPQARPQTKPQARPQTTTTPRPTPPPRYVTTDFPTTQASTRGKPTTVTPKRYRPALTSKYTPAPSTFKVTSRPYTSAPSTSIPLKITSLPYKTTAVPKRVHTTSTPYKSSRYTTRRFTAPPTTLPPRNPISRKDPPSRHTSSPSRLVTRMPLWKLIKNPGMAQNHNNKTSARPTTKPIVPPSRITKPRTTTTTTTTTTRPSTRPTTTTTTTTTSTTTTTTTPRPTPLATTIKKHVATKPTSLPSFQPLSQHPLTDKPKISGQNSKVSIWTSEGTVQKQHKPHGYQEKPSKPQQSSGSRVLNTINKHRAVQIMPYHVDEFQRAMNQAPLVKDGDMAVVYSVPITNVDAFNAMYEHYQEQEAFISSSTPAIVHSKEEETNENHIETTSSSSTTLNERFTNKYTERPQEGLKETLGPGIIKETEAVIPATEEPLPPTPSRSDIPISEDAGENIYIKVNSEKNNEGHTQKPKSEERDSQPKKSAVPENIKPDTVQEPSAASQTRYAIPGFAYPSKTSGSKERKPIPVQTSTERVEVPIPSDSDTTRVSAEESNEPLMFEEGTVLLLPKPLHVKLAETLTQPEDPEANTNVKNEGSQTNVPKESPPIFSNAHQLSHPTDTQHNMEDKTTSSVELPNEEPIRYNPTEDIEDTVFSVDNLYDSVGVPSTQDEAPSAGHYQAPAHLYHEQLPPHYLTDLDLPAPISLPNPISTQSDPTSRHDQADQIVFSADPDELIKQGLLPQPVHYVSTPEEAQKWMKEQYSSQEELKERVFVDATTLNVPPQGPTKPVSEEVQAFNFKKLPFNFEQNQWYHLAFSWSARDHQTSVFVNGQLVGTLSGVMLGQDALPGGGLTVIGQTLLPDLTDFDSTSQFVGEISDVNIWSERLGEESVKALYKCGRLQVSRAMNWKQLSMRFYNDVYIEKSETLCGA